MTLLNLSSQNVRQTFADLQASVAASALVKSVASVAISTAAGSTAKTDYVYIATAAGITITLPTAVGNTNRYTVKNISAGTISVASTSAQTFDGSASPITLVANQSLDFISDNANWDIV